MSSYNIILKNSKISVATGSSVAHFCSSTGRSYEYVCAEADGELHGLEYSEYSDGQTVSLISPDENVGLQVLRYSCAIIVSAFLKKEFKSQILKINVTDSGVFIDFQTETSINAETQKMIEKYIDSLSYSSQKIKSEHIRKNDTRETIPRSSEIEAKYIASFDGESAVIPVPACYNVSAIKFARLESSGGIENGQRIFISVFGSKKQQEEYEAASAAAAARDHRKIGLEAGWFHLQDEARGQIFWHPHGFTIYREIESFIREELNVAGYQEIKTPLVIQNSLWEASGHLNKFRHNMMEIYDEPRIACLKPMNCPCHVQIFKAKTKVYKDLPIRFSEFGMCHRNEATGATHGLMRVVGFTQDDAHIFCTEGQILGETMAFTRLLLRVYKIFGFDNVGIKISTRPAERLGSNEIWDRAESYLREAINSLGLHFEENIGDGAFYGPKVEFYLFDAIGREWQCGTLQLDFVLPERLNATFVDSTGSHKNPIMIHRAILGTLERFIGILIEHYEGRLPAWLSPVQVGIVTVHDSNLRLNEYAKEVAQKLRDVGIRCEEAQSSNHMNEKIKTFIGQKACCIAILGNNEAENRTISIRFHGNATGNVLTLEDFVNKIFSAVSTRATEFSI